MTLSRSISHNHNDGVHSVSILTVRRAANVQALRFGTNAFPVPMSWIFAQSTRTQRKTKTESLRRRESSGIARIHRCAAECRQSPRPALRSYFSLGPFPVCARLSNWPRRLHSMHYCRFAHFHFRMLHSHSRYCFVSRPAARVHRPPRYRESEPFQLSDRICPNRPQTHVGHFYLVEQFILILCRRAQLCQSTELNWMRVPCETLQRTVHSVWIVERYYFHLNSAAVFYTRAHAHHTAQLCTRVGVIAANDRSSQATRYIVVVAHPSVACGRQTSWFYLATSVRFSAGSPLRQS